MPVRPISGMGVFVVDSFSYRTHIQEYDPLATNQTLVSFGDAGGLAVLEEDYSRDFETLGDDDTFEEMVAQEELSRITPRNECLLRIADRFPAPQTWYDE